MYTVSNKILYDSNGMVVLTADEEIFLVSDINPNVFDYRKYAAAIKSNLSLHVVKLYILNDDETPYKDVSTYVLSGNVSYNYQQGQTHSATITVDNSGGFWKSAPLTGNIWRGTKFRLDVGIYYDGTIFWRRCGIFVLKSVNYVGAPTQTATLQLHDKFALFDKTIGGGLDSEFVLQSSQKINESIEACTKGYSETPIDNKIVYFDGDLSNIDTPYTITKTSNVSLGEIMIELADMVSYDIFYNETGNLTLRPGTEPTTINGVTVVSFANKIRPVQWHYTNGESLTYAGHTYDIDYGAIVNKVVVSGAVSTSNVSSARCGMAENTNPYSKSNIYINSINSIFIEDTNIPTNDLCEERAVYELNKRLLSYTKNSFKSVFIPHLRPKDIVMWTCPEFDIYNEKFMIQSLSFNLGSGFFMDIEMANVKELT